MHVSGVVAPACPCVCDMTRGGLLRDFHGALQGFTSPEDLPVPFPGYADNAEIRTTDPITSKEYITTPLVTDYARRFFDCPTLLGAALENNGRNGTAGAHWEARMFQVRSVCCVL
jgi:Leishmanolysin